MKEPVAIYLAACIDCDGCISTKKIKGGIQLMTSFNTTDEIQAHWIARKLGRVLGNPRELPSGKMYYQITLVNKEAKALLERLFPHLIIKKGHAAVAALWPLSRRGGRLSPEEKAGRRTIRRVLQELNK